MIKIKIIDYIKKAVGQDVKVEVFRPENEQFGHYSTNVALKLATLARINADSTLTYADKNPMEIAKQLTDNLQPTTNNFFEKIEIVSPGFINFWISEKVLQNELVEIYKAGDKWGKSVKKNKQIVVIDFSHPNIAKPMHVGHFRSTIIGQALYNIFKFSGWKTIGDNHLGDWGKQFGILIAAYKKLGGGRRKLTIDSLVKLYVDYTAMMKNNENLEIIAREETKKLQQGDKNNIKIWKQFYKVSLDEFKKVYKLLDIRFDYYLGESFYNKMLPDIVQDAVKKGVAEKSEGAMVIFTDKNKTPFIIQKADEAYLYSTTDLAAIKYRVDKFKADLIIYVVDNGQAFYFEQLFKSAQMLSISKNALMEHVKFGLMLGEDMKKFSTRAGRSISLTDVINEGINRAQKIVNEKHPDLPKKEKDKIAEIVGISAIKYNDLSQNRQSDISFNWDKMLNLEGNSSPYIQYTYARLRSILRKSGVKKIKFDSKYLTEKKEKDLILLLGQFPEVVNEITQSYFPSHLADYLYKLTKETNTYYQSVSVLKAEEEVRQARLALIGTVAQTLKTGLNLLGIEVLERM